MTMFERCIFSHHCVHFPMELFLSIYLYASIHVKFKKLYLRNMLYLLFILLNDILIHYTIIFHRILNDSFITFITIIKIML